MLHCLNLLPLSVRHGYLKLITMFNIVNGHSFFHLVFLIHSHHPIIHSTVHLEISLDLVRMLIILIYHTIVINIWNNLPVEIKLLSSVSVFKDHLLSHMVHDEY